MAYGPGDRPGGAKPRKRREPKPAGPPNFPTAVPSRPGAVTGAAPTRGHGPPPPPRPTLGKVPQLEAAPGQRAAQRAGRRAARAQPAPVLPHVPIIRDPTPAQVVAAKQAIATTLTRVSRGGSHVAALRALAQDPRAAHFVRAAQHYAQADEQQTALMVANAAGIRGGRAQQLRAGRILIARHQARNRFGPAPKRAVVTLGPASLPIGALAKGASRFIGAHTSIATAAPENIAFRKVAADIGSLGTAPVILGYEVGKGVADVARGRGTGSLQHTAGAVAGSLAYQVRHPLKFAGAHPGLAALTLAGGVGAAGRVGSAVARGAGSTVEEASMRGALARAGSTERSPLALGSDVNAPIVDRTFKRGAAGKARQAMSDITREPLTDAQGNVITRRMPSGQVLPILKASSRGGKFSERERLLRHEASFRAARANAHERLVRDRLHQEFAAKGIKGRRARELVVLATEGTISSAKHFEEDLARHRQRVAEALRQEDAKPGSVYRHPGEKATAEAQLRTIDVALKSPKVLAQKARIVAAGEDIGRKLNALEAEAIRQEVLDPVRAARSRLLVPAIAHLNARHYSPEETQALLAEGGAAMRGGREAAGQMILGEGRLAGLPAADVTAQALEHGAIRSEGGRFLSNADIEAGLRAKGRDPGTVAFLPHRIDVRGRRAFHARFQPGARPLIDKPGTRTGAAYLKGATATDPEVILEQASRLATQTIRTGHTDRLIGELGLRKPGGGFWSKKEGDEFVQRLQETTGERYVWVSAVPAKLSEGAKAAIAKEQGSEAATTLQRALLNQRIHPGEGAKNGVLVPAPVIDQLMNHLRPAGQIEKFFQALNPFFRMAVLPQFRWLTGNFVEPWFIRLPVEGTGLINIPGMALDLVATKRILKTMRESDNPRVQRAAVHLEAQQIGSGLFIGNRGASNRRELRELGKAGEAAAFFRDLPVMKQAADLYLAIPKGFFAVNRALIESPAQRVAFGRLARREIQSFTGSWIKTVALQRASMEELARGLTNTATQHRFMREQHRMLGQYEGFNPGLRRLTQSVTPFVPWYLNALRFAYWTMPVDHPTITALALQTGNTFEKDWQQMHADVPPGSLRMAIPDGKGGWIDFVRYTPYGAGEEIAGGAVTWQSMISQIAPQLQGVVSALTGEDPFGRPLQVPKDAAHPEGKPTSAWQLLGIAANQLAGSTLFGYSTTQRLREGGRTPFANSNPFSPKTKPGTETPPRQIGPVTIPSGPERTFDPFRPTRLRTGGGEKVVSEPAASAAPEDRLTQLRRQAAQRRATSSASRDRLLELRRAAAARAGR